VGRLVYGARDIRLGACGSYVNLSDQKHPFHSIEISGGLFAETSEGLLKRFFQSRRLDNKSGGADGSELAIQRGMPVEAAEKLEAATAGQQAHVPQLV
jgi:tRNA(adenine34) deaminase